MKPWEMNWEQSNTAIEPASATPAKPWEMNWKSAENPEIDVNAYNGTSLIGQPGEDAKPYSKMDLFMKKLFTFEVRDAAESQKNNSRIQTLEKIRRDGFDDVKWGEVGKSAVRGSFELGKGVTASPLKIYGDWAMDNRDTSLMTPKEADEVKRNNFRAQSYVKIGEYIEKIWDMGIKADWLKEDEETFKGSFVENPSMTRVLSLAASALPSVGFFGGISKITGSRKVASILLAGADAGDIYFEAREAGESQNKALGLYALGTAGTAALEKYGFDQIFNERVTAPLGKRILKAAMSEGFTETFQTGYQNAVKKYGYDDTQELLEGVVEAFIAGSLSGGAISSADAGYIKLQRAREKLKEKGASDNALDVIQEEFARELSYHRDTIEPMFQSKITESLNNLDKFVKEHEGTAEAQKALQTKADLEQVYTDVSERLKKVGVSENVANADAKIWQGIALWGSQESGLSPLEYIKQRMPKVERTTYEQFKNKGKTLEEKLDDYIPFQAMYRSKLPDFGSFYDDIVKNENTKDRYFTEDINGVGLDISRSAIFHDKDGHQLSKNEWLGVIDALKANKIKQARIGDYSKMRGEPVKMVVDVNGVEYGVVFEHMQSGRNLISTVFVLTDKGWMNPKQKKRSQTEASEPLPQSRLLGNALSDIIAALDENVNKTLYQEAEAPKGAYMQNLDRNGVIYLFENADASTFMHETAHFFRKELEGFDTARSREMLQKMSEWENQEFDKRYKLKEENGRYVVADKIGNVIYGAEKPFFDAETAREYARNEIFARGFEQYLREGKAPNNYLKQAFRSFWNWLRHLYPMAEKLDVEINDSIRSVYDEIIGGKDLDFYLTAPVDEVLQQHFAENEERQKEYDRQIALAQAQPVKRGFFRNIAQERTESAKGRNEWWNKAVVPISTRAKRVNIKFRNRLRQYDYVSNNKLNQYYAQIKPFLDKWAKMTETDAIAFDLALKNSYVEKQLEIVNKYDAYDEFVAVKNLLNSLFDQAVDVGIEMGYSADYFPRQIDDVEGFMSAMYGSPYASQLRRALKEADPDNVMTNEERAEFFNKYLRGFNRRDLNKPLPGNVKDRTIDIVTAEMNRYYKPSMQALINYIEGMNTSIESRKFWGFKSDDIDRSIGALTANMIDSGLIKPEQDAEVQEILRARFKARGVTNKYLLTLRNWAYMYTMGGINSAITQIDDISSSLYKAGLWNTVEAVFSRNRPGLSREELGLERIGQEFVEASTSSKAIRGVFKLTGLDKIDAFGKNTLINATFNKFQKMADNNEKELRARLEPVLEEETSQTIADIKNGVISENVKLLMFNELADMQPISLSEMPEWYLTGGNGRVFYMLKTFLIKRLDIFRNECYDKYKQGNVKTSVQNLFRLSILMMMTGMSKDAIIDMLFGREFDLTDAVVNNFLGLFGLSKYSLYQARYEGPKAFLEAFLIPPIYPMAEDLFSDVYKSLFSKKGKDISDYEIWKGFPLVGRFYYWWGGGGRTKLEKKNKNKLK